MYVCGYSCVCQRTTPRSGFWGIKLRSSCLGARILLALVCLLNFSSFIVVKASNIYYINEGVQCIDLIYVWNDYQFYIITIHRCHCVHIRVYILKKHLLSRHQVNKNTNNYCHHSTYRNPEWTHPMTVSFLSFPSNHHFILCFCEFAKHSFFICQTGMNKTVLTGLFFSSWDLSETTHLLRHLAHTWATFPPALPASSSCM